MLAALMCEHVTRAGQVQVSAARSTSYVLPLVLVTA
jgi:hypothetical protein